jgi:hypothetical protein
VFCNKENLNECFLKSVALTGKVSGGSFHQRVRLFNGKTNQEESMRIWEQGKVRVWEYGSMGVFCIMNPALPSENQGIFISVRV